MGFDADVFFSWEHAFEGPLELAAACGETAEQHMVRPLPPRLAFLRKHDSQMKKGK